jgi:hypothetical protein
VPYAREGQGLHLPPVSEALNRARLDIGYPHGSASHHCGLTGELVSANWNSCFNWEHADNVIEQSECTQVP